MEIPGTIIKLHDLDPEKEIWAGSIFRQYEVGRLDSKNSDQNYYDLMLVNSAILENNTFVLINVTMNSDNRGRIISVFSDVEGTYFIQAIRLQDYFTPDSDIFFVQDWQQLLSQ